MVTDQRYCLQCGSRGAHTPGVREGLRAATTAPTSDVPGHDHGDHTHPPAAIANGRANNTTSVIAGVGVLLLAMGIGVLIGRANSGSASGKAVAAPQVISVATPGASTTPTTSTTTSPPPSGSSTTKKSGKASSSGVGQTPSKPAPPAVLKNLRTGGSGQSYEQKSKNLPNVVSTG